MELLRQRKVVTLTATFGKQLHRKDLEREPAKLEGKLSPSDLRSASISADLIFQDWFVLKLVTSGIARVLSTALNLRIESIQDVKSLWFNYMSVGNRIIHKLYLKVSEYDLEEDKQRTKASAFIDSAGRYLGSYYALYNEGRYTPSLNEEWDDFFELLLVELASLEAQGRFVFTPHPFREDFAATVGTTELAINPFEDERIKTQKISEVMVSYEDIIYDPDDEMDSDQEFSETSEKFVEELRASHFKESERIPQVIQEFIPDIYDEFESKLISEDFAVSEIRSRLTDAVTDVPKENTFLALDVLARLMRNKIGRLDKPPDISPQMPNSLRKYAEWLLRPPAHSSEGRAKAKRKKSFRLSPRDAPAVTMPSLPKKRPKDSSIQTISMLRFKIEPKYCCLNFFEQLDAPPGPVALKPIKLDWRPPVRRSLTEFKAGIVNARRNERSSHFSVSGQTVTERRRTGYPSRILRDDYAHLDSYQDNYYPDDDYPDVYRGGGTPSPNGSV